MNTLLDTDEILDVPEILAEEPAQADSIREDDLPDLIDAADFLAMPIEPPAELVTGILHKGSKLAFGGSSKSFKTWCLLDLAISVATGADWLGISTAQGKVLFVNFEIQPHAWQRRIAAVARGMRAGRRDRASRTPKRDGGAHRLSAESRRPNITGNGGAFTRNSITLVM